MFALSVLFFLTNEHNILSVLLLHYKDILEKVTMQVTRPSFIFVAERTDAKEPS